VQLEFQHEIDFKRISTLALQKDDPISVNGYEAIYGFPDPENSLDPSQIPHHEPQEPLAHACMAAL